MSGLSELIALKKSVEHHIKEEEADIFDRAKETFSKYEAQQLGQEFETNKRKLLKRKQ